MRNSKTLYLCNLSFINYQDAIKYCEKYQLDDILISTKTLSWYKYLNNFPQHYAKFDLNSGIVAYNYLLPQTMIEYYNLERIFLSY